MKVKSSSRFFSMKKVTLSFVTVFIGIGTIGSLNQYADASTKTQQTHVTTSSPTKKTTHTVKRSVNRQLLNLEQYQRKELSHLQLNQRKKPQRLRNPQL